jgi:N-ethylmaleimide reductase
MSRSNDSDLFQEVVIGGLHLRNRIVMAAMTRARAGLDGVPSRLMIDYYRQRASAGLIISEGIAISPMARGYLATPGLFTPDQVEGWRPITDAVHEAGGKIMAQLWHVGRISHPDMLPGGRAPFGPSPLQAASAVYAGDGFLPCAVPQEMTIDDIRQTFAEFASSAAAARSAGFDGVQIHAGNGYLPDQFLRDSTNKRTDDYGGTIENRTRFLLEVVAAVVAVVGRDIVSVRIAPGTNVNDISDSDPEPLFTALGRSLGEIGIAFLDVVEGATTGPRDIGIDPQIVRRAFPGPYMGNNGYTRALALADRNAGKIELVGFGRAFISNPDLVERLQHDWPLALDDRETYYGGDAHGYTDYPSYETLAR